MRRKNEVFRFLYYFMVAVFVIIIGYLIFAYKGPNLEEEKFSSAVDFSQGWKLDTGETVGIKKLNKLDSVEPYQEFVISNTLPETLHPEDALCFRSKNIFYKVYVDGELIYEPYVPNSRMYNDSFGTRWNYLKLNPEDAGAKVEIYVTTVYKNSRAGIDTIYISSELGAVLHTMREKLVALITCIILLFVGFLLIVADIPINMQKEKNHELLYLGLFAVSIAVWCTSETHLLQFLTGDSRMLQLISCFALMLIPIPMVLYLDSAFGFRNRFFVPVFSILSFAEFLVCMVLHFTGVADFHDTLTFSHVLLALCAIIMLYTIIKNSFVRGKNPTKNIYRILRGIGLCGLSFATVIDIIRYYQGNGSDSAMFVRIGLLIFVVCYGSSSLEKTINAVKLGVQSEFISQLAYKDGLTGVGNRTAFQEQLVDLEKIKETLSAVGIIMFDINDLKYVNDHLGHRLGDRLIVESAEMIKEAFAEFQCDCFRIGGDEFVILASGENVEERCREGMKLFQELMAQHNRDEKQLLRISVAHGFALYTKGNADSKLMDIYQRADMLMYENKKKVKANQSTPEEYYLRKNAKGA